MPDPKIDSVLTSIKAMLGIEPEYTHFDPILINHINSVFVNLASLGVGPDIPVRISSADDEWSDEFLANEVMAENVKSYMYLKVRLLFDPPTSTVASDAFKENIKELEFRLKIDNDDSMKEVLADE